MSPKILNRANYIDSNDLTNAAYIGRGSPYGNPFVIGKHGTRDDVCRRFECEVDVSPLRGKNLICWCAPERCHGDAILKKANA